MLKYLMVAGRTLPVQGTFFGSLTATVRRCITCERVVFLRVVQRDKWSLRGGRQVGVHLNNRGVKKELNTLQRRDARLHTGP